jgi:hypothetical protein
MPEDRLPQSTDNPTVRCGPGEPEDVHLVEDSLTGVRVVHEEPLPDIGATQAAITPDKPSVWEAIKAGS